MWVFDCAAGDEQPNQSAQFKPRHICFSLKIRVFLESKLKRKKETEVNNGGTKSVESECHKSTDEARGGGEQMRKKKN